MASKEDLALLQQTMPTGLEGLKALEKFTRDGNAEVRKLLYDECEVVLECRYCRNMFRSPINFVSHKRAFCRVSHVSVALANQGAGGEEDCRMEYATKKRLGQMTSLTKRLEQNLVPIGDTQEMLALYTLPRIMKEAPTTTFADGFQRVIGSLPSNLARKETLPEDRTCVVMPQDNSSRYKEMKLRSRKAQNTDKQQHRDFTSSEIKIIENFEKHDVRCGDFVQLQCDHPSCAHLRPFHSVQALAFHCSLRHTKAFSNDGGDDRWPCLLCCRHMWSLDGVHTHMMRVHPNVKELHLKKRNEDDKTAKGGKRSTHDGSGRSRSRSLSLSSETRLAMDEQENDSEEEDAQEEMIIEEDDGRGNRRRSSRRHGSTAVPLLLQQMDRQSRVSATSDDYGEPPVLRPVNGCGLEEEADEEEEKEPRKKKKKNKSTTPKSEMDEKLKEVKEEEEDEEEQRQTITPVSKPDPNTVEGIMEYMLDAVCEVLKVADKMDKDRTAKLRRESTEDSMRSTPTPPSREVSTARKRGRPKKSDIIEKKASVPLTKRSQSMHPRMVTEEKKEPVPLKKRSQSRVRPTEPEPEPEPKPKPEPEVRVKRQYIRKKDREAMEAQQKEAEDRKEAERQRDGESASSELSDVLQEQQPSTSDAAAAAAEETESDAARPSRHRKRPRWMMDGEEVVGETAKSSQNQDQSNADKSEGDGETAAKEEIKKKKVEKPTQLVTPVKKMIASTQKPSPLCFTPMSGKHVQEKRRAIDLESPGSSSSSKRKQNLGKLADESDPIMIVSMSDDMNGPKRSDLTSVPVYLSEHQQSIFFSGLMNRQSKEPGGVNYYECMYCNMRLNNVRDGRRHMVGHLRVMRLRCGLCGAGAFFCIDMRNHLQMRGCPELNKAPKDMVKPGTPCMTKAHADELTFVAHSGSPGRALFTSGKIVSILNNSPYLPDPVIEEKILGPTRVPPPGLSSPRKPAHKFTMASVLKEVEKSAISFATAAQRALTAAPASPASPAASVVPVAAAAASSSVPTPILPMEDTIMDDYEDTQEPELAVAAAAAPAETVQRRKQRQRHASLPPPDTRALRTIGEPKNDGAAPVAQPVPQSARRVLAFSTAPEAAEQMTPTHSRQMDDTTSDSEMLSPLQARHRSIYPSTHRMRSSDSTASSQ